MYLKVKVQIMVITGKCWGRTSGQGVSHCNPVQPRVQVQGDDLRTSRLAGTRHSPLGPQTRWTNTGQGSLFSPTSQYLSYQFASHSHINSPLFGTWGMHLPCPLQLRLSGDSHGCNYVNHNSLTSLQHSKITNILKQHMTYALIHRSCYKHLLEIRNKWKAILFWKYFFGATLYRCSEGKNHLNLMTIKTPLFVKTILYDRFILPLRGIWQLLLCLNVFMWWKPPEKFRHFTSKFYGHLFARYLWIKGITVLSVRYFLSFTVNAKKHFLNSNKLDAFEGQCVEC